MKRAGWVLALLAGCSSGPPPKPVYLNRELGRVVVLPPFNETMNRECWKTVWPMLLAGVGSRGYRVVSQPEVEAFYARNNFKTDPGEIKIYRTEEIAREFKADAVLYSNILRWGGSYVGVYSEAGVEIELALMDGKAGGRLWETRGAAVSRESVRGRNVFELAFSLIGVAGNAALRSTDAAAERAVAEACGRMPLAGLDPNPGTDAPEGQSQPSGPR
jgi:hypothetical protein